MTNNEIVHGFDDEKDDRLAIALDKTAGVDDCLILRLTGRIDTGNSLYFQRSVNRAIEAGYSKLIFDLRSCVEVSSAGMGSFTAFLKRVKPLGGDMVLLGVQPLVYDVIQLLGFSQFFNIRSTPDEAAQFFARKAEAATATPFPTVIQCPACGTGLKVGKAGRFRCSKCGTTLVIDTRAQVSRG